MRLFYYSKKLYWAGLSSAAGASAGAAASAAGAAASSAAGASSTNISGISSNSLSLSRIFKRSLILADFPDRSRK